MTDELKAPTNSARGPEPEGGPKAPPPGLVIKRASRDSHRFATIASRLAEQAEALRQMGNQELADRLGSLANAAHEVAESARELADKTAEFRSLSRSLMGESLLAEDEALEP